MKWRITVYSFVVLAAASSLAQTTVLFTAIHALPSNQVELIWSSDTNRWYAIERTVDLTSWSHECDFVIPDGSAPIESNHWTLAADTNPCFFRILASPVVGPLDNVYTSLGTASNDTQVVIGTTNMDYVIQYGEGSNDTQYASTGDDYDWIAQYGGTGADTQTVRGGSSRDWLYQDGGPGNDVLTADGGDDNDRIVQRGGVGADDISSSGGWGSDFLIHLGGPGNDVHSVDVGDGNDTVLIHGDEGEDDITYDWSAGEDSVLIDGGSDIDNLTVYEGTSPAILIRLEDGTELYTNGPPDTAITVANLESIYVVDTPGTNGMTNWSWP